jgi:hypothetical protein
VSEDLAQELGDPRTGIGPDLSFLVAEHVEETVEAPAHQLASGAARSAARFMLSTNSSISAL